MKISSQAFSIGILFFSFIFMQVACSNSPEPEPVDDRLTIRLKLGETLPKSNNNGTVISIAESLSYDIDTDILTIRCSGSEGGTPLPVGHQITPNILTTSPIFLINDVFDGLDISDGLATFTGFLRENGMDKSEFKEVGEHQYYCATVGSLLALTEITYEVIPIKDL